MRGRGQTPQSDTNWRPRLQKLLRIEWRGYSRYATKTTSNMFNNDDSRGKIASAPTLAPTIREVIAQNHTSGEEYRRSNSSCIGETAAFLHTFLQMTFPSASRHEMAIGIPLTQSAN